MIKHFFRDIQLYKSYKKSHVLKIFLDISIYMVLLYRISNFFYRNHVFIVAKIFWLLNRLLFCIDIDPGAKLGPGLRLVHPMSIVIGREVISEGDLVVYQNVTIGGSNNKTSEYNGQIIKQPYFKKNVILYASSVILGPIIIGENSIVAANATISKDVEDNNIAFGFNKTKINVTHNAEAKPN